MFSGTPGEVPSAKMAEKVVATRQDVYAGMFYLVSFGFGFWFYRFYTPTANLIFKLPILFG